MKMWNIYLRDDGLEENHETFTVTLRNPRNAVLGQRSSASVEIVDPRGGNGSTRASGGSVRCNKLTRTFSADREV